MIRRSKLFRRGVFVAVLCAAMLGGSIAGVTFKPSHHAHRKPEKAKHRLHFDAPLPPAQRAKMRAIGDKLLRESGTPNRHARASTLSASYTCAASRKFTVWYAMPKDKAFSSSVESSIRTEMMKAAQYLDNEAIARGGRARPRFLCSSDPYGGVYIRIQRWTVDMNSADDSLLGLRAAVDVKFFPDYSETHLIYYGDPIGGMDYAGVVPMLDRYYALYNGRYAPQWDTFLHEMGHLMGAVEGDAPNSTTLFILGSHCKDGLAIMCYADNGTCCYSASVCTTLKYDCHGDDYFNAKPKPGSWLDRDIKRNAALSSPLLSNLYNYLPKTDCYALGRYPDCAGSSSSNWMIARNKAMTVVAGDGDDVIQACCTPLSSYYDPLMIGGAAPSPIISPAGPNRFYGGNGNDRIEDNGNGDLLDGGTGNDTIIGRGGSDSFYGQDGNDTIYAQHGADKETVNCGAGTDVAFIDGDILGSLDTVIGCEVVLVEQIDGTSKLNCALSNASVTCSAYRWYP